MILIRQRLQTVLEDTLTKTQFGFRPSRSTSHALFLTRRMQDIAEQQGSNLIITFLGWEKASHKVQHEKQHVALRRFGVHQHFFDVIKRKLIPTFASLSKMNLDEFGTSSTKRQAAGIRQGCPLSLYLFVLGMSIIDHDISHSLDRRTIRSRKAGIESDRIYYSDDIVLHMRQTECFWAVERISKQFGLLLNGRKCSHFAMNRT